VLGRVQRAEQGVGGSAPESGCGSTYQSAWVTKLCSGSSSATMSIGSCSEIETRLEGDHLLSHRDSPK